MKTLISSLEFSHFPVMLSEVIKILSPIKGGLFVDCTFGGGGYSSKLLQFPGTKIVAFDRDSFIERIAKNLKDKYPKRFTFYPKKFSEISEEFLSFIQNKRLIIHNAEFDLSHLNNELQLLGKNKIENEIIDTLSLARDKYPGSTVSLDALCKRFRIDNSKRVKHTALIDCDLLAKVYINLIDQKEPTFDLINTNDENLKFSTKSVQYFKKIIKPSVEESRLHENYLKQKFKKHFF